MKWAILPLAFSLMISTTHAETFSMEPYLKKCGGKIYPKCDAADLNQEHIFEAARTRAATEKTKIMLVIGADWCPACRQFAAMLAKDQDLPKLLERFTFVEINGDATSTKKLTSRLKLSNMGYPQAFIINPEGNEIVQQFYPSMYSSVQSLIDTVGVMVPLPKERPEFLGSILLTTLEKPIELSGDFGAWEFILNPRSLAEKYVDQGVSALQVYHYVDAYRSFKEAERRDPALIMAYVGQILATLNIETSKDADYFVAEAVSKVEARAKVQALSETESAWFELAKSLQMAHSQNYIKPVGSTVKSVADAYNDILVHDTDNLDGQALVTWAVIGNIELSKAKEKFNSILAQRPNNIGAHHSLLHIAEMENNARAANEHATALARLAPRSAHAQHMFGHTLPQQGRWVEAIAYFKKADAIHHEWATKNGFDLNQDWHYAHNLDLLASTYLGSGDLVNARATWLNATSDPRAIAHVLALTVVSSTHEEADAALKQYEDAGWADYLKPLRQELELTTGNAKALITTAAEANDSEPSYDQILQKVLVAYVGGEKNPQSTSNVTSYFAAKFISGGFDGWSNAYLELLRLKRVAKILSMDGLTKDLESLEFGVHAGALCGQSEQGKSLVRCLSLP